jgi:hypothetical protein
MQSLKLWLDTHPAIAVIGVAVSVGSMASGVTAYMIERLNKVEMAQVTGKYNADIADLSARLSSIERRAGPDEAKKYFDAESIQVLEPEVKNLSSQFKNYDNGSFFLNLPITADWKYSFLSEGEAAKVGVFKQVYELAFQNEELKKLSECIKVHAWFSDPVAQVTFNVNSGGATIPLTGPIAPRIIIFKITRDQWAFKAAMSGTAVAKSSQATPSQEKTDILGAIKKIEEVKRGDILQDTTVSPPTMNAAPDDQDNALKNSFDKLFTGDIAGSRWFD